MSQEELLKGLGKAVKELNAKIDSLVEENKQLREEVKQLREENAKLRAELEDLRQQLDSPQATKKGAKSSKVLPGFESLISNNNKEAKDELDNKVKTLKKQAKEECTKVLAPINEQLAALGVDGLKYYIGQSQRKYDKINEENKQLKMEIEAKDAEIARLKKLLGESDNSGESREERLERLGVK